MSELRQQLHRAKAEYENLRYPGDLAEDIFPATAGRIWPRVATIAGLAVAAVVALAIWLNAPAHTPKDQMVVKTPPTVVHKSAPKATPKTGDATDANFTTEEVTTDYPDGVTIVPTLDSMGLSQVPSMPSLDMSMPSLDEMMSSSTATTQEAS
jgi:hypothetical protein